MGLAQGFNSSKQAAREFEITNIWSRGQGFNHWATAYIKNLKVLSCMNGTWCCMNSRLKRHSSWFNDVCMMVCAAYCSFQWRALLDLKSTWLPSQHAAVNNQKRSNYWRVFMKISIYSQFIRLLLRCGYILVFILLLYKTLNFLSKYDHMIFCVAWFW